MTGNAGEFALGMKDEGKRTIFIRPASLDSIKPINLFVSSDRSTVALLLQPVDTPSDTIVIREAATRSPPPARRKADFRAHAEEPAACDGRRRAAGDMEVRESARQLALWPGCASPSTQMARHGIVGESTNSPISEKAT